MSRLSKLEWMLAAQATLEGLELIHAARVLHGDPFPRNILVERREPKHPKDRFLDSTLSAKVAGKVKM
jgi:serine/threonine protein kinase